MDKPPLTSHDRKHSERYASAGISYSPDAAKTFQRRLDELVGHCVRVDFRNGTSKDVRIVEPPAAGFEEHGCLMVRDWDDAADRPVGEPYTIDLYDEGGDPSKIATRIIVY